MLSIVASRLRPMSSAKIAPVPYRSFFMPWTHSKTKETPSAPGRSRCFLSTLDGCHRGRRSISTLIPRWCGSTPSTRHGLIVRRSSPCSGRTDQGLEQGASKTSRGDVAPRENNSSRRRRRRHGRQRSSLRRHRRDRRTPRPTDGTSAAAPPRPWPPRVDKSSMSDRSMSVGPGSRRA